MPKIITITGVDGSGKSTLIQYLKQRLPGVVLVSIWDLLMKPDTRKLIPFKSPQALDAYLEIMDPTSRAYFLFHCYHMALTFAKQQKSEFILADSYWYKYFGTEVAHGGNADQLRPLIQPFPQPDLNLYLEIDIQQSSQRKDYFSGYECGFSKERNLTTFREFQVKASSVLQALMDEIDPVRIDARKSAEEVAAASLSAIQNRWPELIFLTPDPTLEQITNSSTKTIAILGIDGSGKSYATRELMKILEADGRHIQVMTCPEYHDTPGAPHTELSRALLQLGEISDELGHFGLKALALFFQMSLFGPVQAALMSSKPGYLITERHAIIDTLVYGAFYKSMLDEAGSGSGEAAGAFLAKLAAQYPEVFQEIQTWMILENGRLGRTTSMLELLALLRQLFNRPPMELVEELSRQYRTTLPDVIVLIDIDPEIALARVKGRGGKLEMHEQISVLYKLRDNYLNVLAFMKDMYPEIEIHTVSTQSGKEVSAVLQDIIA